MNVKRRMLRVWVVIVGIVLAAVVVVGRLVPFAPDMTLNDDSVVNCDRQVTLALATWMTADGARPSTASPSRIARQLERRQAPPRCEAVTP
jgi:hypothetical protein